MKRLVMPFLAALLSVSFALPVLHAAETGDVTERFYGKVIAVDHAQKNVTVHNAKKKSDSVFQWDDSTRLMFNKKSIPASDLKIGQSLIVSYVAAGHVNRAQRITVRAPFKKAVSE